MALRKGEMLMDQIDRKLLQILSQNAAATATEETTTVYQEAPLTLIVSMALPQQN